MKKYSNTNKRFKFIKKNKTNKKGGDKSSNILNTDVPFEDKKGIVDNVGEKIYNATSSAFSSIGDTGLKIIGLERINKQIDDNTNTGSDTQSNMVYSNGTTNYVADNISEVLNSDVVKQNTKQIAEDSAALLTNLSETFNKSLEDPIAKKEIEKAIKNAGEISTIVVDAAKEPLNKAIDVASEAIPKASGAAISGVVKVGTDAMAAVPYIGSLIEFGKILNDSSKAVSSVVEASSEAIDATSNAYFETKQNIEKGLKELNDKKYISANIAERTTNSIKDFETPINTNITQKPLQSIIRGGYKTKRLKRHKSKTKRVRFTL